jgi:hypothetical protein
MSGDAIPTRLTRIVGNLGMAPNPITPAVLAQIAELFSCQWATLWLVHPDRPLLHPDLVWNLDPSKVWHLTQSTTLRTLSLSEGTAGHVWRSRKPVWTSNLARDMCLPRSLYANEAGLRGGIWFAIQTESVVYGVIELLGIDIPPSTPDVLLAIEELGKSIGRHMDARRSNR